MSLESACILSSTYVKECFSEQGLWFGNLQNMGSIGRVGRPCTCTSLPCQLNAVIQHVFYMYVIICIRMFSSGPVLYQLSHKGGSAG